MKFLLDTHTFLWWITDDTQLSEHSKEIIGDSDNQVFLSAASGWEIAIKSRIGRLKLPRRIGGFISEQMSENAISNLSITMSHALQVSELPDHHRDPFDRLLISQSQIENMPILSVDPLIRKYNVQVVW